MDMKAMLIGIVFSTATGILVIVIWNRLQARHKRELMFRRADFVDARGLILKIGDAQDPVSQYILLQSSYGTQTLIEGYDASVSPPESLIQSLITTLNHLLGDRSFFQQQRFENVELREETRNLAFDGNLDDDLCYFNRMLIEDVYCSEIVKRAITKYLSRDARIVATIFAVLTFGIVFGASSFTISRARSNEMPSRTVRASERKVSIGPSLGPKSTGDTRELIQAIKRQQEVYVGLSTGPWAQDNFTAVQLKLFKENNTIDRIRESLRTDQEFLKLVEAIRSLSPQQRDLLLEEAAQTYKPTWTELELDSTINSARELRNGQTKAGQEAERLIAEGVANLVRDLV